MKSFSRAILFGFGLAAALIAVLGAVSLAILTTVLEDKDRLFTEHVQDLVQAQRLSEIAEQVVASGRAFLITRDEEYLDRMEDFRAQFTRVLSEIAPHDEADAESIETAQKAHEAALAEAIALREENASVKNIAQVFESKVQPLRSNLRSAIDQFVDRKKKLLALRRRESDRFDDRAYGFLGIASAASIGISALLFALMFRTALQFRRSDEERTRLLRETQEAVQARDEFLSIASHELKTPLTSIILRLQMAARSPEGETARRSVELSLEQSKRLGQWVEELLDLTRIRAGKLVLNRERMDLGSTLRTVVSRFQGPIECAIAESIVGWWDPVRMEQVATNLISNALKYGTGKPIRVQLERAAESARLLVADQGVGMDSEEQGKIFERFERASSAKGISGLGLGLYITRQIVEAHGGTIRVQSEKGNGSTFTVELPFGSSGPALP